MSNKDPKAPQNLQDQRGNAVGQKCQYFPSGVHEPIEGQITKANDDGTVDITLSGGGAKNGVTLGKGAPGARYCTIQEPAPKQAAPEKRPDANVKKDKE